MNRCSLVGCVVALSLFAGSVMAAAEAPKAPPAKPAAPAAAPEKDAAALMAESGAGKFADALKTAGLLDSLKAAPVVTVIAPTDAAFATVKETDPAKVKAVLQKHIVMGKVEPKNGMVADAKVTKTATAKNCTILVVDKVLSAAPAAAPATPTVPAAPAAPAAPKK